ncbi:MAG: hypothetical protein F6K16_10475 [Symploca sp. SIO2B6]|nr:hypothetical protein [Symploca sp. SIO2B6]
MSEADNLNNQPFPESTASTDESETQKLEAAKTSEEEQIAVLFELLNWDDTVEESSLEQTVTLETVPAASTTVSVDVVDEGEQEVPDALSSEETKETNWLVVTQKMRQRNRRLLEQVTQLEQALQKKQEALNSKQELAQEHEKLLAQQSEKLSTTQEQLTKLFETLESSHQAAQRQQILIETLSEQLESSQERVAQLERECALTQQRYNEQSHQLLQQENICRELRSRLQRQQRQTLQFKAALEKSLEMSTPKHQAEPQQVHPQRENIKVNRSLVPKARPIQPWSAQPEVLQEDSNIETISNRPIRLETKPQQLEKPLVSVPGNPELEVSPLVKTIEEIQLSSTADAPEQIINQFTTCDQNIEPETEEEKQLLAPLSSLTEASDTSPWQTGIAEIYKDATMAPETDNNQLKASAPSPNQTQETLLARDVSDGEDQEYKANNELIEDAHPSHSAQPNQVILPQSNWPSPTLYPLRTPKKRKSLAAIELPNFPRHQPS